MRLAETTKKIIELFEQSSLPNAAKEAEFFVREVLGLSLTDFVLQKDKLLPPEQLSELMQKAQRRASGEPLAYIVGYQDFFKQRFVVSPAVLIPRADTEVLVEEALKILPPPQRCLDLGTGSGCIGLSLLCEWPQSHLTTIDISLEALQVAKQNAKRLGLLERVDFIGGDVLAQHFTEPFDLIVSNPPYISPGDSRLEANVISHEPHRALFADEGGLSFYKKWTPWAKSHLRDSGWLLFECGDGQAADVHSICLQNGFKNIKIIKDLAFKDRVIVAQKPER
jgi:release factor glutamine methyltransferase